jgi:transposase
MLEYVHSIVQLRRSGVDIIYIDQTSFNAWDGKERCWQPSKNPLTFSQMNTKTSNFTVYGGISELTGRFTFKIYENTSIDSFLDFMKLFKNRSKKHEIAFVLDNHSSHRSNITQDQLDGIDIGVLFLPPYSSEYNPIERMWALIKNHWRKSVMIRDGDYTLIQQ